MIEEKRNYDAKKILASAKKRRAMLLKLERAGKTCSQLARDFGVTRQAMSTCLQKARRDENEV